MEDPLSSLVGRNSGIKLSLYFRNDPSFIKGGLNGFIANIYEILLKSNLSDDQIEHLIAPLRHESLGLPVDWPGASFAVFRDQDRTTIIPLICEVPARVVVATSFHVKPLLSDWTRATSGQLIYASDCNLTLYQMGRGRARIVGTWAADQQGIASIRTHLVERPGPVVVVGESTLPISASGRRVIQHFEAVTAERAKQIFWNLTLRDFDDKISREIDMVMANPERVAVRTAIDLAKQVERRRFSKLFITIEDMAWGEWDEQKGVMAHHQSQASHRDDDIFDDIAESLMKRGTTVRVVPRRLMPLGITALAI